MTIFERLIRNKSTEKDVCDYLQKNGFRKRTAEFDYLELKAIERPGWVQIFEFHVRVQDDEGESHRLLGLVRDDERNRTDFFHTTSEAELERVFAEWSDGLITLRRERSKYTPYFLALFVIVLGFAILGAVMSR